MDYKVVEQRYNIKIIPNSNLVRKLRNRIVHFEKEYKLTSQEMLRQFHSKVIIETEGISRWIQDCQVLEIIEKGNGRSKIDTVGTH